MEYDNNTLNCNQKKIIFGTYIKMRRLQENMSLSFVSEIVKISKGFLSEIERGRRKPSDYALKQILKVLDTPYYDKSDYYEQARDMVDLVMNDFEEMSFDDEKDVLEKFLSNTEYKYSTGFMQYYLLEFAYQIHFKHNHVRIEQIIFLLECMDYEMFTISERLFLLDLLALYNMDIKHDFLSAQLHLESAIEQASSSSSSSSSSSTNGVILYHLIDVYQQLNLPVKALMLCGEAESYFIKSFNVKRLAFLNMHKANCLSRLHMFDEAEKIYLKLLKQLNIIGNNSESILFDNLAWNSLKSEDFDKSIEYAKKSIALGTKFNATYECIPYAYFKSKRYEQCLHSIEQLRLTVNLEERQNLLFKALEAKIKNKEAFIDYFKKYIQCIIDLGDDEMIEFALKIKFHYYLEIEDFKKACECSINIFNTIDNKF